MDFSCDDVRWADWTWQYRNRIARTDQLAEYLPLSEKEKQDITACLGHFRMAITPYYASLINPDDPADPIRLQAVPTIHESCVLPCEMADPLSEERDSPVQHIVHRYPDRVLFLVTHQCAMYCRHCTRRRLVGEEDHVISEAAMEQALTYIRDRVQIRDVLISGGDPLTLSDCRLEQIVASVRLIEHVDIIRIGTRVPVVMPMRITPGLLDMLKKYQPIWINTHFNHPRELTNAAIQACGAIVDAGIPLGNQSVLLKGINDNVATMKDLLLKLVKARIRPYYLYQCDLSQGLGHFRTDVRTGIEIIRQLTGNISGYAVPRFVIDAPGGGGKIAVNYNTILSIDDQQIVLNNYQDKICIYPQPPH